MFTKLSFLSVVWILGLFVLRSLAFLRLGRHHPHRPKHGVEQTTQQDAEDIHLDRVLEHRNADFFDDSVITVLPYRRKRETLETSLNVSEAALNSLSEAIENSLKGNVTSTASNILELNGENETHIVEARGLQNYTKVGEKKKKQRITEGNATNNTSTTTVPVSLYKNKTVENEPLQNSSGNNAIVDQRQLQKIPKNKQAPDVPTNTDKKIESTFTKKQSFMWDFAQLLMNCENVTSPKNYSERLEYVRDIVQKKRLGNHSSKEYMNQGKHCLLTDGPFVQKHPNATIITKNFQCIANDNNNNVNDIINNVNDGMNNVNDSVNNGDLHVTFVIYPHDTCMSLDVPRHRMTFSENATCLKYEIGKQIEDLEVRHEVVSCVKHKNHTGEGHNGEDVVLKEKSDSKPSHGFGWLSFLFGLVLGGSVVAAGLHFSRKIKKKRRGMRLSEFDSSELTLELDENSAGYQTGQWRRQINPSPIL